MLLHHGGAAWGLLLLGLNIWRMSIYRQGKLVVSERIEGKVVSADLVADCIVFNFRQNNFSEIRWCGVGQSCRVSLPH